MFFFRIVEALKVVPRLVEAMGQHGSAREFAKRARGLSVKMRAQTTRKVRVLRKKVDVIEDCRRALAEKHSKMPDA